MGLKDLFSGRGKRGEEKTSTDTRSDEEKTQDAQDAATAGAASVTAASAGTIIS